MKTKRMIQWELKMSHQYVYQICKWKRQLKPYSNWLFFLKTTKKLEKFSKRSITMHKDIQFRWQFLITYSGFWLVNVLLRKFDTSSKAKWNWYKHKFFDEKQEKNVKKVYVNIKYHPFIRFYHSLKHHSFIKNHILNSPHWPVM